MPGGWLGRHRHRRPRHRGRGASAAARRRAGVRHPGDSCPGGELDRRESGDPRPRLLRRSRRAGAGRATPARRRTAGGPHAGDAGPPARAGDRGDLRGGGAGRRRRPREPRAAAPGQGAGRAGPRHVGPGRVHDASSATVGRPSCPRVWAVPRRPWRSSWRPEGSRSGPTRPQTSWTPCFPAHAGGARGLEVYRPSHDRNDVLRLEARVPRDGPRWPAAARTGTRRTSGVALGTSTSPADEVEKLLAAGGM